MMSTRSSSKLSQKKDSNISTQHEHDDGSPFLDPMRGATSTPGTLGSHSGQLQAALQDLLVNDNDLLKSVSEAVANIISAKLLSSPDLMQDLAKSLCANDTLLTTLTTKLTPTLSQNINDSLSHDIEVVKAQTSAIKDYESKTKSRIDMLENKIDQLEQYSRRNCLLIHGLKETTQEDTTDIALNLFADKLELPQIHRTEIDRSHRLGPKNRPNNTATEEGARPRSRPRPIIVKFRSYDERNLVFRAKTLLKGTKILITENLTAQRMKLFKTAKATDSVKSIWTHDGKIHCVLNSNKMVVIENTRDLEKL